jgi:hypothetical protein
VKRQNIGRGSAREAEQKALLIALSDDLALPLLQIRSGLELIEQAGFSKPTVRSQVRAMAMSANSGLQRPDATSRPFFGWACPPAAPDFAGWRCQWSIDSRRVVCSYVATPASCRPSEYERLSHHGPSI